MQAKSGLEVEEHKCWYGRDVVSISRRSQDVITSRLGAICLGLGPAGLISGLGHCVSSRRFVQAHAVHTVAAVRAILTSMTFVA